MPGTGQGLSGKNGKVRINTGVLRVTEWNATIKSQKLDQTNSESGGYGEYLGGIVDTDITLRGNFEVGSAPMTVLPPGSAIPNVVLYVDAGILTAPDGSKGVYNCTLFVESFAYSTPTRGLVTINISGSSTGVFGAPLL